MKPEIPEGTTTRGWLLLLGALAAAKAVGLIALMSALAAALAQVAAGKQLDVAALAMWGISGALVRAFAAWGTRVASQRAAVGVKEELRGQLLEHRLRSGGGPGEAEEAALASRGLDGLDPYFRDYLPALVSCAVIPVLVGARILAADWVSALILVLTVPLVPIFMILIGLHTAERVAEAQSGLDRLGRHLGELARGLPVVVGLRRAAQQREALRDVSERHRLSTMGTLRTAFLSAFALELIATLSVAVVAVFIGVRLVWGTLGLEAGLIALMLAPDVFLPLRELGSAHHASEDGVAALRRVRGVLDRPVPQEAAAGGEPEQPGHPRQAGSSSLTGSAGFSVRGLSVSRPGGRGAVGPVSFDAVPGSITALLGPSGCGKSTVLDVLAGTVRESAAPRLDDSAESGLESAVESDAVVHAEADLDLGMAAGTGTSIHGEIVGLDPSRRGVVPQAPSFACATARQELELTGAQEPTAELRQLLPRRLWDSPLERLSPGERRRVAVARGLATARSAAADGPGAVVLLDEPTAHLDHRSAQRVRSLIERIAESGVAVVLATHDPLLAAIADQEVRWSVGASAAPTLRGSLRPARGLELGEGGAHEGAPRAFPSLSGEQSVSPLDDAAEHAVAEASDAAGDASTAEETPDVAPSKLGLRALWSLLPLRSPRLWLAVGLGALSVAAAAALSGLSGWLIVEASTRPHIMYLMAAIVGVRFFGLARATLRYRERLATHDVVLRWSSDMRVRLWDALGSNAKGWSRLTRPGGALGTLIAEVDELRDALPRALVPVPAAIIACLGAAVAVGIFAPAVLPVLLVLLVLGLVVLPAGVLWLERASAAHTAEHRADVAERTGRVMAAAPDLAANGLSARALAEYRAADDAGGSALRVDAIGSGAGRAAASLITGIGSVVALVAGANATAPGLLALSVLLILALDEPLGQLADALRHVPVLRSMLARLAPWLAPEADADRRERQRELSLAAAANVSKNKAPRNTAGLIASAQLDTLRINAPHIDALRVEDLAAGYGAGPVFSEVSGQATPGSVWAVTGPSGSGKSTLIAAVLGFLTPSAGRVSVRETATPESGAHSTAGSGCGPRPRRTRGPWPPGTGSRGARRTATSSTARCAGTWRCPGPASWPRARRRWRPR